jgi:hypothetical protein
MLRPASGAFPHRTTACRLAEAQMRAGRRPATITSVQPSSQESGASNAMAEVHASDPNKPPIRDQVQPDFPWVHIVIAAALGLAAIAGGVVAGLLSAAR